MTAPTSSPDATAKPAVPTPQAIRPQLRTWRDRRSLARATPAFGSALAKVEDIEGFTSPVELSLLFHLARVPGPGHIVEIGSYLGRSTIVMAHAARDAGSPPVVAVDPHTRALGYDGEEPFDTREHFEANLRRTGVAGAVRLEHTTSVHAAARWDDGPVRLLFVDGWHSHEAVLADVRAWQPHLRPDASVVFDDFLPSPGVRAAVRDLLREGVLHGDRAIVGKMAVFAPRSALKPAPTPVGARALAYVPDRALDLAIRALAT